jgi:hypothetical protein
LTNIHQVLINGQHCIDTQGRLSYTSLTKKEVPIKPIKKSKIGSLPKSGNPEPPFPINTGAKQQEVADDGRRSHNPRHTLWKTKKRDAKRSRHPQVDRGNGIAV